MIAWTEEDVKFIINNILNPMFEGYAQAHKEVNDISHETYMKVLDTMATRIRDLDYERHRDKDFFLAYLGQSQMYSSKEILERAYENYCKEYDKLNKHLLNAETKENVE